MANTSSEDILTCWKLGFPRQRLLRHQVPFLSNEALGFSLSSWSSGKSVLCASTTSRHSAESPAMFPRAHTAYKIETNYAFRPPHAYNNMEHLQIENGKSLFSISCLFTDIFIWWAEELHKAGYGTSINNQHGVLESSRGNVSESPCASNCSHNKTRKNKFTIQHKQFGINTT